MPEIFASMFNENDSAINASKLISQVQRLAIKKFSGKQPTARSAESANTKYESLLKLMNSINLHLSHVISFLKLEDEDMHKSGDEYEGDPLSEMQISKTFISAIAEINSAASIFALMDIQNLDKNKTVAIIGLVNTFYEHLQIFRQDESVFAVFRNEYVGKKFDLASDNLLQNAKFYADYQEESIKPKEKNYDDDAIHFGDDNDDSDGDSDGDDEDEDDDDNDDDEDELDGNTVLHHNGDDDGDDSVPRPARKSLRQEIDVLKTEKTSLMEDIDRLNAQHVSVANTIIKMNRSKKSKRGHSEDDTKLLADTTSIRDSMKEVKKQKTRELKLIDSKIARLQKQNGAEEISGSGFSMKEMERFFPMKRGL